MDRRDEILRANELDLQEGKDKGLSQAMLDRVMLNEKRIRDMALCDIWKWADKKVKSNSE